MYDDIPRMATVVSVSKSRIFVCFKQIQDFGQVFGHFLVEIIGCCCYGETDTRCIQSKSDHVVAYMQAVPLFETDLNLDAYCHQISTKATTANKHGSITETS